MIMRRGALNVYTHSYGLSANFLSVLLLVDPRFDAP